MVGAAARGAEQSPCALIGQSPVIDVTCDSFQREEKCFSDSEKPGRMRSCLRQHSEEEKNCCYAKVIVH